MTAPARNRLPAAAIVRFTGQYAFLSNFYLCHVVVDGEVYPSVEHAYQASKTKSVGERNRIQTTRSPGQAKALGRRVPLRTGWDEMKRQVMLDLLRQKFAPSGPLATKLLDTGTAPLVEGNGWNDRYWGAVLMRDEWIGENHLGRLLEHVRAELWTHQYAAPHQRDDWPYRNPVPPE